MTAPDTVAAIVMADAENPHWLGKLNAIGRLLESREPDLDTLAYVAVYLHFVGTGAIACGETGGHHRPNHHAAAAERIRRHLAKLDSGTTQFVVRRILPWLPSAKAQFARPEPFTRIREIAHRNDIPPNLKREIKTTLQNKLHRCAGPEDLRTSEAFVARFTSPNANLPPAFVEEFRRFHEELEEFFQARSLEQDLEGLVVDGRSVDRSAIATLLEAKRGAHDETGRLAALERIVAVRESLAQAARTESDSFGLAVIDLKLEDYAFTLLSALIGDITLRRQEISDGSFHLRALLFGVVHVRLGGVESAECGAVESELRAWSAHFTGTTPELLRLAASAERARRISEAHAARIQGLFERRSERLGCALRVAEASRRVFSEGQIRRHLVFQVSKLAQWLVAEARKRAGLASWEAVAAGAGTGTVREISSLSEIAEPSDTPLIVLTPRLGGDEEIAEHVRGIVLRETIPHLSHVAIRARHRRIPVAVVGDDAMRAAWTALIGSRGRLDVSADGVRLSRSVGGNEQRPAQDACVPIEFAGTAVPTDVEPAPLPLDRVTVAEGGAKADALRRLAALSVQLGGFRVPKTLVIPNWVMMRLLALEPLVGNAYADALERLAAGGEVSHSAAELRRAIAQLRVPKRVLDEIAGAFDRSDRLMVRSSANGEDLRGLSGAGLYDTVANVGLEGAEQAIRTVWGSLVSERALRNMRQSGIAIDQARMAVIVQRMVRPDYSFVLHTANPITGDPREVAVEIAVGMGETLARAEPNGVPYRLVVDVATGAVRTTAFANYSHALVPHSAEGLTKTRLDYAKVELSRKPESLEALGWRLAALGKSIERALSGPRDDAESIPQDIEGAVVGETLVVVQSRPQERAG